MSQNTLTEIDSTEIDSRTNNPGTSVHETKVVVIGAGPAGLTAAYELTKKGIATTVLEKDSIVGGIARTETYKGYSFDMGGHRFFTKSDEVNEMWQEVSANEFHRRSRLARVNYKKKFFNYPLKPLNALIGLGFLESCFIMLSYIRWQLFPYRVEETFEQWVTNRFGKRLFLTFFKTYTEKVWGISCSELRAEWAAQRIKDLSVKTIILSMFSNPGTRIKTLIEQFDYPRLGPGMMWKRVSECIEESAGTVRVNCGVTRIRRSGDRITSVVVEALGVKQEFCGKNFISSMPLTEFIQKLDPPPPAEVLEASHNLRYRDFLTVCLIVKKEHLFNDNWIYIHDSSVKVGRIQNYKNWSPDMVPDPEMTGLGLEYFCNEGDELWNSSDKELIELGKREVDQLELANYKDIEEGCVFRVPKSYPVYDATYKEHLAVLRDFVMRLDNFQTIGRNGLHRYNNQDHAMLTGMQAVSNLVSGEAHDLWSVNADQEYHEELRSDKDYVVADVTDEVVQEFFETVFAKLDRLALGLSLGTMFGVLLFLMTIILVMKSGTSVGPTLSLLSQFLPGYTVTTWGSLVALAYGFVVGFVAGWLFAFFRNLVALFQFAMMRRRAERAMLRRFIDFI
ncbi:MAG: FAD-dependent oxidoreductase [Pirellulales bacterium]